VVRTERCLKCGREETYFLHACRVVPDEGSQWKEGCPVCDDCCDYCEQIVIPGSFPADY